MASASVILGTVLLLGLLGLGIAQVALDTAHGSSLVGAVVQQKAAPVDQRDLNLCMNDCMRACVTEPGTEKGCNEICVKQCGA